MNSFLNKVFSFKSLKIVYSFLTKASPPLIIIFFMALCVHSFFGLFSYSVSGNPIYGLHENESLSKTMTNLHLEDFKKNKISSLSVFINNNTVKYYLFDNRFVDLFSLINSPKSLPVYGERASLPFKIIVNDDNLSFSIGVDEGSIRKEDFVSEANMIISLILLKRKSELEIKESWN